MKHHYCADTGRHERQGFPEAIYSPGKTPEQIIAIAGELLKGTGPVIATRAEEEVFLRVKEVYPHSAYHPLARIIHIRNGEKKKRRTLRSRSFICVITAGTTDIAVAEEAAVTAEILGSRVQRVYDVGVAGMHRLMKHEPTRGCSRADCKPGC
jgi:NCAIR mutase (PurE)-related protein